MMSISEDEYHYSNYEVNTEEDHNYVDDIEECPPLIKTKSRIIYCVVNNDVEGLKSLINYPNLFQIHDSDGYPVLHIAIVTDNIAVFDLLLSQDDCPIEALNKKGETALEVALTGYVTNYWMDEHFAYSLVKKGANIDYISQHERNSLLHCALDRDYFKTALLLAEKGVDLNCQSDDGTTPIHLYFQTSDENETIAMLLCFGADPSIPDFNGYRLADSTLTSARLSTTIKETLLFYLFDEYSTGYDIPIDTLFNLLEGESPIFPQLLKHITSVNVDKTCMRGGIKSYFVKLFVIKPEYLNLLLEKFDCVIDEILDASLKDDFTDYTPLNEMFIQNFDLLLQSQFSSDVIQIVNRTQIYKFIEKSQNSNVPQEELFQSIMLLLSYGANICDKDLEVIYEIYGDCEYFRILLHMDIEITDKNQHCDTIMPSLLYNIHFDIETFLDHCAEPSPKALIELLNYFAHPKLQHFCCSLPTQNEEINVKIQNCPSVPLLLELARNKLRKFLIQKYKITKSMHFYTVIKHLPISNIHEKIITFEKKLYENY